VFLAKVDAGLADSKPARESLTRRSSNLNLFILAALCDLAASAPALAANHEARASQGKVVAMFSKPFPILYTDSVERLTTFYSEVLGFTLTYRWPAEGIPEYTYLTLDGAGLGIAARQAIERLHGKPVARSDSPRNELCLYVENTDVAAGYLRSRGVQQLTSPATQPWGERVVYFLDPDGNPLHITARTP
jgi:catechol 2,3-dioxygenase-like lactoylglutathione lyase family enzyme